MGKINTCLKSVFAVFNILFAIVGGIIIGLALVAQFYTSIQENLTGRTTGLFVLYIVGAVTLVIAVLGAYGAHTESKCSLVMFLVCTILGSLVMLVLAIPAAVIRSKAEGMMEHHFQQYLPLDQSTDNIKNIANNFQKNFHCCGLFSHSDWNEIPDSCLCDEEEQEEGECQNIGYSDFMLQRSIYSKTCFPIIMYYALFAVDITIGLVFTLTLLALFGMILSSIMIHQIRYTNQPTILLTMPTIFSPQPPKYEELHNPPPY
ncbi:tetraspanin-8-like [Archocentrus centrarchus]|uniref:tetraspanin-8-like n=1 Tax=Archocentrus centrarchus TaxID=63155 RepID=UPI0011E9D65C|nr:tetraspanin-8-like [Archocentrus centrarchus]